MEDNHVESLTPEQEVKAREELAPVVPLHEDIEPDTELVQDDVLVLEPHFKRACTCTAEQRAAGHEDGVIDSRLLCRNCEIRALVNRLHDIACELY